MSRIQLKIMGALAALVLTVVAVTGVVAERRLRSQLIDDIERSLTVSARLVGQMTDGIPFTPDHTDELGNIAAGAARATTARVTLIAEDGRVLADSEVPKAQVASMDNHAGRPEVVVALQGETGSSLRFSDTVKRNLLYVAIPTIATNPDEAGVIRLALGLDRVDSAIAAQRSELLIAGALGLLAALAFSYGLSLITLRPIRELAQVVSGIASGQLGRKLHWNVHDERGQIARSINTVAQQLQDQLVRVESERGQLDSVLSSMVEGVLVIDVEGHVVLANPRLRELFSIWGEIEGRPLPELIREPAIDRAFQEASIEDETVVRDLELRSPKERVLSMHAARFPADGPRAGTVFVFHDVTEVRRVDKVRRDFIANASHELRTPLTAIQGFADTLSSSTIDAEQTRSYLEVIGRNAQRMSDLLEDLLALSRIEGGRHELEITEVDVGRIAEMAVSDFKPRFEQAGLTARLERGDHAEARADRRAVEQILGNLLSNAAKYTNEGGHIDVSVRPQGDSIVLSVADDGIGIPERSRERIFERFYRVDAARSRALGSTGLGLSIVKHLATSMGGEINVESELDVGSRFTLKLPAA